MKKTILAVMVGICGRGVSALAAKAFSVAGEPMTEVREPTGGYPVTDRHTGKAKERREAKRRRRAKGRK
ncbi:hypothetical protein [Leclercia sp.]|uniref:hypothetical protein n=1 Tax=Leclercia sp. TaxID=1898428 RepID=UPI0028BE0D35|nr:hypothetical protein [Leclercia sp.]